MAVLGIDSKQVRLETKEETVTVPSPPEGVRRTVTRYKFVNKDTQALRPRTRIKKSGNSALADGIDYVDLYGLVSIKPEWMRDDTGPVWVLKPGEEFVEELDLTPLTPPYTLAVWIDEFDPTAFDDEAEA